METLLDVKIDNLKQEEIYQKIEFFLTENKFHQIATINPEFILEAQKDSAFKNILNGADLNVVDGIGIWFAYLRFGKLLKTRVTGIDLMLKILTLADQKKLGIFLVANQNGLSTWQETREAILKLYPNLKINGRNIDCHSEQSDSAVKESTLKNIRSLDYARDDIINCDIVFANFGAPFQEKFLNSLKNDKIRIAMGVGGSFDFLTGKVRRAPKIMRQIGLEWFWRLVLQPQRWKRIWNAVIIFPIKVIFNYR